MVQGQDLFKVAGTQDGTESIDSQVAMIYNLATQTPTETLTLGSAVSGYLTTGGTHLIDTAAESVIAVNRQKYHNGTTGLFSAQRGAFGAGKAGEGDAIADMSIGGGVGYGRIFDVRTRFRLRPCLMFLRKPIRPTNSVEVAKLHWSTWGIHSDIQT